MSRMKRGLALLLVCTLFAGCLSGCGKSDKEKEKETTIQETNNPGQESSGGKTDSSGGKTDSSGGKADSTGEKTDNSGGKNDGSGDGSGGGAVLPLGADYILGSNLAAGVDFGEITVVYGTENAKPQYFADMEAELPQEFFVASSGGAGGAGSGSASGDGSGSGTGDGAGGSGETVEAEFFINDLYTSMNYWWGVIFEEMEGMTDEEKAEHLIAYSAAMLTCQTEGEVTAEALEKGLAVVSMYPHPVLLNNYGTMLMYVEEYDLALDVFEIVYDQTGDLAIVLTNIASCYYEKGDIVNAKKCCEEALVEQQGFGPALQLLGSIALEEGEPLKALEYIFRSAETYWNPVSADHFTKARVFLAEEQARTGIHPFEEYPHLYDLVVTALKAGSDKTFTGKTKTMSYVSVGNLEAAEDFLVESAEATHDKYYDTVLETIPDKWDDKILPYQTTMISGELTNAMFEMQGWDKDMDLSAASQLYCFELLMDYYEYQLYKRENKTHTITDEAGNYLNPYVPVLSLWDQIEGIDEEWEKASEIREEEYTEDYLELGMEWEEIWDAHKDSQRHANGSKDDPYNKCNDCYLLEAEQYVDFCELGYEHELDQRELRLLYLRQMYAADDAYWSGHIKPYVEEFYKEMTMLLQYIPDETIQGYCSEVVEAEMYYYGTTLPYAWAAERADGLELARSMLDHYIAELGIADQRVEKERHVLQLEIDAMGLKPYQDTDVWGKKAEYDLIITDLLLEKTQDGQEIIGLKGPFTGVEYKFNLTKFEGSVVGGYSGNAMVPMTDIKDGLAGEYGEFYRNMPYLPKKFADTFGLTPDNVEKAEKTVKEFINGPVDWGAKQLVNKGKEKATGFIPTTREESSKVYSEITDPQGRVLQRRIINRSSLKGEVEIGDGEGAKKIGAGYTKTVTRMGCAVKTQRQIDLGFGALKLQYTK